MNTSFWKEKRIFITGHTGFKGSWLCLWLQQLGSVVKGYSLEPSTSPNLFNLANLSEGMISVINDIRDGSSLERELRDFQPEIVFHMAAQPLVRQSYLDPIETYATNVMGTVNLLEAIRKCDSVRSVLIVTTDKCYDNKEWFWGYRENDTLGGSDPYSSSKACTELVAAAYRESFFNPIKYKEHRVGLATARAGNVFGGGDWAKDRLIPDIIRSFENSTQLVIRNPKSVRPWQHVLEPLFGYINLSEKLYYSGALFSEAWNFGPKEDDTRSVEWLVEFMVRNWHTSTTWRLDQECNPHEANHLKLDISKVRERLGWIPKWRLDQGLIKVIEWNQTLRDGGDLRSKCLEQINEYIETSSF